MKKYKLNANFNLLGGFWKSDKPDDTFTGTISSNRGLVELSISPTYEKLEGAAFIKAFQNMAGEQILRPIGTILGYTTEKRCSLLACYTLQESGLNDFSTGQKIASKRFRSSRTVMGLHLDSLDTETIDGAAFYFTKIHNWLPTPWNTQMTQEATTYTVPTSARESFSVCSIDPRAEIVCQIFAGGAIRFKRGVSIKPVPRIKVIPLRPQSVEWYNSIGYRLENFFALFLGTSVALKRVQLFQGEADGWLVQKMRHRKQKINRQTWVICPQHRVARALAQWLAVPEEKRPVELILLGALRKSSLFNETEFLSLAQALEGFSRIYFRDGTSKRVSFAKLVEKAYDLLSTDLSLKLLGERSRFVRQVVDTRNYYTHLGTNAGNAVVDENKDLFLFNQKLHAFLRGLMLIDLGVLETEIREPILYQAFRWQ
jgi:hypothetical protein